MQHFIVKEDSEWFRALHETDGSALAFPERRQRMKERLKAYLAGIKKLEKR